MDSPRAGEPSSEAVAARAAERAGAFVRGLDRHRVLACGRPFPSSAAPAPDDASDPAARPVVSKTMMALWREDLAPFRNLGTSLAMVEVSSAVCKAYDYEFPRPASLSPNVVEGLLRLKLGFEGAALADVRAAALVARLDPGEAAIRALSAGCDLLLIPGPDRQIETVLNRLGRALELGQLAPERVEQALGRVRTVRKLVPPPGPAPSQRDVEELSSGFAEFGRKFAVEERGVA